MRRYLPVVLLATAAIAAGWQLFFAAEDQPARATPPAKAIEIPNFPPASDAGTGAGSLAYLELENSHDYYALVEHVVASNDPSSALAMHAIADACGSFLGDSPWFNQRHSEQIDALAAKALESNDRARQLDLLNKQQANHAELLLRCRGFRALDRVQRKALLTRLDAIAMTDPAVSVLLPLINANRDTAPTSAVISAWREAISSGEKPKVELAIQFAFGRLYDSRLPSDQRPNIAAEAALSDASKIALGGSGLQLDTEYRQLLYCAAGLVCDGVSAESNANAEDQALYQKLVEKYAAALRNASYEEVLAVTP